MSTTTTEDPTKMTEDEILAVYHKGPDAVVDLVGRLSARLHSPEPRTHTYRILGLQASRLALVLLLIGFVFITISALLSVFVLTGEEPSGPEASTEGNILLWGVILHIIREIVRDIGIAALIAGSLDAAYNHWIRKDFLDSSAANVRNVLVENGIEIPTKLDGTHKKLDGTYTEMQRIISTPKVQRLSSNDEIYEEAKKLISDRPGEFRATILGGQGPTPEEEKYAEYFGILVDKLKNENEAYYKFVAATEDGASAREELLRSNNVPNHKYTSYLPATNWSLNILIKGNDSAIIAFPTFADYSSLQCGIRIDDETFVRQLIRWYENCLIGNIGRRYSTT